MRQKLAPHLYPNSVETPSLHCCFGFGHQCGHPHHVGTPDLPGCVHRRAAARKGCAKLGKAHLIDNARPLLAYQGRVLTLAGLAGMHRSIAGLLRSAARQQSSRVVSKTVCKSLHASVNAAAVEEAAAAPSLPKGELLLAGWEAVSARIM